MAFYVKKMHWSHNMVALIMSHVHGSKKSASFLCLANWNHTLDEKVKRRRYFASLWVQRYTHIQFTNRKGSEILHACLNFLANVQSNQNSIHQRKHGGMQKFCIIMCSNNRHEIPIKKRMQKFCVSMSSEVHSHSIYKKNGCRNSA